MSGFWDAVGRAALGLPGTATPRPRSMFEPGEAAIAFEEVDASLEGEDPVASDTLFARAPMVTTPPAGPVLPLKRQDHEPDALVPHDDRIDASPITLPGVVTQEVVNTVYESAATWVQPERDPPRAGPGQARDDETLERPEQQRYETTYVVAAPPPNPRAESAPVVGAAAWPPSGTPQTAEPVTPRSSAEEPDADGALAVVAEPHAVVVDPPAPPPVAQEPPLVIDIERIDIRIQSEHPPAPTATRAERPAVPSLSDYLSHRSGVRP